MTPHPPTLSQSLSREANNFDLVRLIAACAFVWSATFVIRQTGSGDGVAAASDLDSVGSLGVYAFFLMSGLLVSASFERQRSASRFVALRFARVLPAAFGAALVALFVVGPILTPLTLHDYFAALVMKREGTLSIVFDHGNLMRAIGAPLWALTGLMLCYLLVLITGAFGLLSTRRRITLAVLITLVAFLMRTRLADLQSGWRVFPDSATGLAFAPELCFLLGMVLYGWRERISISGLIACGLLLVFLVFRDTAGAQILLYIAFVYGLLWVSVTPMLHGWRPRHDYSYAICLYGFMVQQCVAARLPGISPMLAVIVGAPFILALAVFSSRWIERPAMKWCRERIARNEARQRERRKTRELAYERTPLRASDPAVRWPPL
ncbi:acyltransferase [Burkholderia sp. Ac-20365]|uniref:acyltransferase family protein n=1 Tax=Burkholderia sp. Ac-20365 TaxID=2703897 RepID=UPI00197BE6FE|nr:acyltransferase [Burkholderia sp. Ac-20365]MBN3762755.1 acyltransferase [Burkholderia sp. Ac-20365]